MGPTGDMVKFFQTRIYRIPPYLSCDSLGRIVFDRNGVR